MATNAFRPWLSLLLLCVLLTTPALADRFHVRPGGTRTAGASTPGSWNSTNCYDNLPAAVAEAAAADTVLLDRMIHSVTIQLDLPVALVANSQFSDDPEGATVELASASSLFLPAGHGALEIRGLTLLGDGQLRPYPALLATDPDVDLTLVGCRFRDFVAPSVVGAGGGALRVTGNGRLTVRDCSFTGNVSHGRGGAVFLRAGLVAEFDDCRWNDNSALVSSDARGGAVMIDARTALTTATFRNCEWRDNTAGSTGGALATLSAAVTMEDCRVHGSSSGVVNGWSEGAALHFRRDATDHTDATPVVIRRSEFIGNRGYPDLQLAAGDGGAMEINGANADRMIAALVEDCLFRENFNLQGAGVYVSRFAEGIVRRCRFYDNIAQYHAGGVFKGGAVYETHGETLTIDTCLFVRNRAGFTADGEPNDDYCRGGAIVCRMFPRVVVRNCTFIDNTIDDPGYHFGDAFAHYYEYGDWEPDMLCTIQNCVFWGENGVDVQAWSSPGGMAYAQNNAAAAGELDLGGVTQTGTVVLTASPFTSLEGGFPVAGGPLIDAAVDLGIAIDLDGRGIPTGGGPDIGCYEWYDIVPVQDLPGALVDLTAGPNPFNPRTVLSCRLDRAAGVQLVLYDARGHEVRTLWSGALAAGDHRWTWDGRDDDGRGCASGVYLAQLLVDDGRMAVTKLTLVR